MNATGFATTILLGLGLSVSGRAGTSVRLIGADELERLIGQVSVLDAREEKVFLKGHLPGSVSVDWRDYTLEKPGAWNALFGHAANWGKVPKPDAALQKRLRDLGLSNAKPIVVVGAPHGWGEEGRIGWNLLYWGAENVMLLDGGFPAWIADSRRAVKKGRPAPAISGDFSIRLRPERRAELPAVREALRAGAHLLDARSEAEFAGKRMPGQKRGGHLPGARLVPVESLYRSDGRYIEAAELERLLSGAAGAKGERPISYCTGGVRSGLLALLMEARLGTVVANYDGSIWEWSDQPDLLLETVP